MAEELGHIDIRFPNTPGGGAGDTTGPLPTKLKMPDIGASIGTSMRAMAGDVSAIFKVAISAISSSISAVMDRLADVTAEMRERGKFSPDVMMENVASQLQTLSNQFEEAQVLGPLYAMVLRWYRELMQLLQPWKLLFQTIVSFLAGAIIAALSKLMQLLNAGLEGLLTGISSLLEGVATLAAILSAPGAVRGVAGAVLGSATGNFGVGFALADALADAMPDTGLSELIAKIGELAALTQNSIDELRAINNNTSKKSTGSLDWAAAQLREIASRSSAYPTGYKPFYQPGGRGRWGQGYP